MIVQAAYYEQFMSLDSVAAMGWWNILWVLLIVFLALAAKAKKLGVTSIGKNEWGMLEIFGFPLIPIPFGLWPFIKGIFHVKQVSTAPVRIDLTSRREVQDRVLMIVVTVFVRVTRPAKGSSLLGRFLVLRKDLIAALYGTLDENVDDSENPERIEQTRVVVEAATRQILKESESIDEITLEKLEAACGDDLRVRFGEYLDKVYLREDAPVDGQLWKEGRTPLIDQEQFSDNDAPPAPVVGLHGVSP